MIGDWERSVGLAWPPKHRCPWCGGALVHRLDDDAMACKACPWWGRVDLVAKPPKLAPGPADKLEGRRLPT